MRLQFNTYTKTIFRLILLVNLSSCAKDWLEVKPELSLVVPSTISDYQAMLDNNSEGSAPFNTALMSMGEIGACDFYLTNSSWSSASVLERNAYIWNDDIFGQEKNYVDWEFAYNNIYYANIILEGIEKIQPTNSAELLEWNQVKGSAYFFRAYRHFDVAQVYCKPYDKSSSSTDLGIPLRLTSNFNETSTRSSAEETYRQILQDLNYATDLLPVDKPINITYKLRPTKTAAYAMLSRVYLSMSLYDSALNCAVKALQIYNKLINFNSDPPILPGGVFRIPRFNDEVILHMVSTSYTILTPFNASVDSNLYKSYNVNDKRKEIYFFDLLGSPRFVGSYDAGTTIFSGLTTSELYLIVAECLARAGNKDEALNNLNALMENRWSNNATWSPFTASTPDEALTLILNERRKELIFRGTRWSDLRRLNKEVTHAVTLSREIEGSIYSLPPNSLKYVLPIPPDVIKLTGMPQNPR